MGAFLSLLRRDLRLALRQGSDSLMIVIFFVVVVVLFPLAIGPEQKILSRVSAGIIWVAALLAAMLSMDRLFETDYEDGSLDLLVLAPHPIEILVLAKVLAHWLTTGLPLIIISPLLGIFLHMQPNGLWVMILSLLLGTPVLSLIGSIGAALTLGSRRSGVLISLLILPLFIPVLIFGVSAVDAALMDLPVRPQLLLLGALFLGTFAISPWASAAALRQAVE